MTQACHHAILRATGRDRAAGIQRHRGCAVVVHPADLQAWGWRIPFALGLLLNPLALYLRKSMPETLASDATLAHPAALTPAHPGHVRLGDHRALLLLAILVVLGGTVATYVGNYMTTYAITTLKLAPTVAMSATLVVGLATVVFSFVGGWLSDRFGRKPTMLVPRILSALLVYPAFVFLAEQRTTAALLCSAWRDRWRPLMRCVRRPCW